MAFYIFMENCKPSAFPGFGVITGDCMVRNWGLNLQHYLFCKTGMTLPVQKTIRCMVWDVELGIVSLVSFRECSGILQSTDFVPGTVLGAEDK